LPFPTPEDLSGPGTEPISPVCPVSPGRQILYHCTTWEFYILFLGPQGTGLKYTKYAIIRHEF